MSAEPAQVGPTATAGPRRTHPLTPLISGWKVIAAVFGVVTIQNLADLIQEFSVERLLLFIGILAVVLVVTVAVSALTWWRTTYEITPDGVDLRHGLLTLSHRTAPREKIESVSVERPALARVLGLAKVRVDIAGGSDSHLDLAYVRSGEAEQIRVGILEVAGGHEQQVPQSADLSDAGGPDVSPSSDPLNPPDPSDAQPAASPGVRSAASRVGRGLREHLYDGVTDGDLIARIPTSRLLRSMVRDLGFLIGLGVGIVWIVVAVVLAIAGPGVGMLVATLPALVAVPQTVMQRVENGWGFVSRDTARGVRMRRGLFSTRTDNIGSGRVQEVTLHRPLLWRGPGWTRATVTVAGLGGEDTTSAGTVLPVGTGDELARTLGHLVPPLGSGQDSRMIEHLLTAPARELGGVGPVPLLHPIGRRTRRVVLLPAAVLLRSGILTSQVQIVPRERIQGLRLAQGPLDRLLGSVTLTVSFAAGSTQVSSVPVADAIALCDLLRPDAVLGRRYDARDSWPHPVLAPAGGAGTAPDMAVQDTGASDTEDR